MGHERKRWPHATPATKKIPGRTWNELLDEVAALTAWAQARGFSAPGLIADRPPHVPVFRCVRLGADLDPGVTNPDSRNDGTAADVLYWDRDDAEWKVTDPAHEVHLGVAPWQDGVLVEDTDTFAYYHPQRGMYIPITPHIQIRRFVFKYALIPNPGTTTYAEAHRVFYDPTEEAYDYEDDTFEVCDPSGFRRAPSINVDHWGRVIGTCWKPPDWDYWEILDLPHQAKWIEFVVDDVTGFTTANATVAVDDCTYHDGYEPFTEITIVHNMRASGGYVFEGADGARGKAEYDIENNRYEIYQMECP